MLIPGLVSATFRQLEPSRIVTAVKKVGLQTIEWSENPHVPVNDLRAAATVGELTREAGLQVAAYGSYYNLDDDQSFEPWIATCIALGAPLIRIWAGWKGSDVVTESVRAQLTERLRTCSEQAANSDVKLSLEFHENTLADTLASTQQLLRDVAHPALMTYWQLVKALRTEEELQEEMRTLLPWLAHVHVFFRNPVSNEWKALAEGKAVWRPLLDGLRTSHQNHAVMIEFVREHSLDAFRQDAEALKNWIR